MKRSHLVPLVFSSVISFSDAATITNSSRFWDSPSRLDIEEGSNTISGTSLSDGFGARFVTLYVPEGLEVTELNILSYSSSATSGGSFLGLQLGHTLSASPEDLQTNSDPINYILFSDSSMGNLLPTLAVGNPLGGVSTLTEGAYALWFNETGPPADFSVEWVATTIPEPSAISLLAITFLGLLRRKR